MDGSGFKRESSNETISHLAGQSPTVKARDLAGNRDAVPPGLSGQGDLGQEAVDLGGDVVTGTTEEAPLPPAEGVAESPQNALFLEALEDREVPQIRRHLMWAGVTYNTRFTKSGWLSGVLMALWTLAAVAGTVLLFGGPTVWGSPLLFVAGAVGPLLFSVLWGSKWQAGIWFGYGVGLLVPAGVVVLVSFGSYWLLERAFSRAGQGSPPPSLRDF